MAKNKFWEFKNIVGNDSADLYIYNEISSWDDEDVTSAQSFKEELDSIGDVSTINLYINSPGGSVADGLAIASMLKRNKAKVVAQVDGLACSIASVIACSADKVVMGRNCMMMIHNALSGGFFYDNAKGFRKLADDLDKISESLRSTYIEKSNGKLEEEQLVKLMDEETWLTAKECLDLGLCDEIVESNKMVASISNKYASFFNKVPSEVEISDEVQEVVNDDTDAIVDEEVETVETVDNETDEAIVEDTSIEEETIEEVEDEIEDDSKIDEPEIENLKRENEDLKSKLNDSNEKIILLNDKINEMQPIVDKYNSIVEEQKALEDKKILDEKRKYFKDKFDMLGATSKFESNEVQALLENCMKDNNALSKLNQMIVDMVSISDKKVTEKIEKISKIENLISFDEDIKEKYGFK